MPPCLFLCWKKVSWVIKINCQVTLPETNIAPEDRPSQKETIVFQSSIFRCELLVYRRVSTWRIIPVSKWLGSPPFISHKKAMNGRGPTTRSLGDLGSPWLLTPKHVALIKGDQTPGSPRWPTKLCYKTSHPGIRPMDVWTLKNRRQIPRVYFLCHPFFWGDFFYEFQGVYVMFFVEIPYPVFYLHWFPQYPVSTWRTSRIQRWWNRRSSSHRGGGQHCDGDHYHGAIAELGTSSEQWKKGPWLFRVYRDLYYPVI